MCPVPCTEGPMTRTLVEIRRSSHCMSRHIPTESTLQPWFVRSFPRSGEAELMDQAGLDPAELAGNLRDIRRVNHLLGGTSVVLRHLPQILAQISGQEPVTILDLATGSADIPVAIARWAKRRGIRTTIAASDYSAQMLALAG